MSKKFKYFLFAVVATILLIIVIILLKNNFRQNFTSSPVTPTSPVSPTSREKAKVNFVYDGDTIQLSDGRKVRYIGINTPEIGKNKEECFGKEAANINKQLVSGQIIEMEKDLSDADKYGRLLRFVFIDNIFVNEFLLQQGYARLETIPPDVKYSNQFSEAEKEARENKRGLWKEC